ncbi:TKL protein kinase [Thecamonas trahens ATCC 50062]|uniref:TKL protein kinase n=1 Tax=Thecamonas trahens ATCC 50062 TaxID=461836 RepID=A0A0L0DQ54_THETB|nr:TKL protein kinase [Thecamonas trahens ATCC 50062]KNC54432.1 TKL protein kinase [Thecamonas trahens ATCC 50062]|eukprot:XP_013753725.1 TKL protein kinase [Thecamonas trahens ATCC 50062]
MGWICVWSRTLPSLVVVVVLVLALAVVDSRSNGPVTEAAEWPASDAVQPRVRIAAYYQGSSPHISLLQQWIAAYNAYAAGNTSAELVLYPLPDSFEESLPWVLGGMDVILTYPSHGETLLTGAYMVPLDEVWQRNDLEDAVLAVLKRTLAAGGDHRYGVPALALAGVCTYRKSMFAALGVTVPSHWTALLALCAKAKAAGRMCLAVDVGIEGASALFDLLFIRMYGHKAYSAFLLGDVSFVDGPVRSVMEEIIWLHEAGYYVASDTPAGRKLPHSRGVLSNSSVISCGVDMFASMMSRDESADDLASFAFPVYDGPIGSGRGAADMHSAPSTSVYLAAPRSATNVAGAVDFLAFVSSAAGRSILSAWLSQTHASWGVPVFKSVADELASQRTALGRQLLDSDTAPPLPFSRRGLSPHQLSVSWIKLLGNVQLAATVADAREELDAGLETMEAIRLAERFHKASPPRMLPVSGTYLGDVEVTMTSVTPNATMYYTLDGSMPTPRSAKYRGPFRVRGEVTTVRAIAVAFALYESTVAQAEYKTASSAQSYLGADDDSLKVALGVSTAVVACAVVAIAVGVLAVRRRFRRTDVAPLGDKAIPFDELDVKGVVGLGVFGMEYMGAWQGKAVVVKHLSNFPTHGSFRREFNVNWAALADEMEHVMHLSHPNVSAVLGLARSPPVLVNEFVPRGSLYNVLHTRHIALDSSVIFMWAHKLCEGMAYLVEHGVTHGSLSSLSIRLDNGWQPKLCDFGFPLLRTGSTSARNALDRTHLVESGRLVASSSGFGLSSTYMSTGHGPRLMAAVLEGSLSAGSTSQMFGSVTEGEMNVAKELPSAESMYWLAPEVLQLGANGLSRAADAYALGIVLWELTTRRDVYWAENPLAAALDVVRNERRPNVGEVPVVFDDIRSVMVELWRPEPEARMEFVVAAHALGALYSESHVILPRCMAAVVGRTTVVHCELLGALRGLLCGSKAETARLTAFHHGLPELAKRTGGTVFEWGLGWVTAVMETRQSVIDFARFIRELELSSGPVTVMATHAELEAIDVDAGRRTLAGPAMSAMRTSWRAMFGPYRNENLTRHTGNGHAPSSATGVFAVGELASVLKGDVHVTLHKVGQPGVWQLLRVGEAPVELDADAVARDGTLGKGARRRGRAMSAGAASEALSSELSSSSSSLSGEERESTSIAERVASAGTLGVQEQSRAMLREVTAGVTALHLLTTSEVAAMVEQGGEVWQSSLGVSHKAELPYGDDEELTHPVVVKVLARQTYSASELVVFAAVCVEAAATQVGGVMGPIAVCVEAPYMAIVTPRFEQGSLADALTLSISSVTTQRVRDVCVSILSGLAALHAASGRGHGALRPSNIMLEGRGLGEAASRRLAVTLVDFGLEAVRTNLGTVTQVPVVRYMSPEALRGVAGSQQGDIFVAGTIIYELVTGFPAFGDESSSLEAAMDIVDGKRPVLDEHLVFSESLRSLIQRCWLENAQLRPSADELLSELSKLAVGDFIGVQRRAAHGRTIPAGATASESSSTARSGVSMGTHGPPRPHPAQLRLT